MVNFKEHLDKVANGTFFSQICTQFYRYSDSNLLMSRDSVVGDGVGTCRLSLVPPEIDIRHMILQSEG